MLARRISVVAAVLVAAVFVASSCLVVGGAASAGPGAGASAVTASPTPSAATTTPTVGNTVSSASASSNPANGYHLTTSASRVALVKSAEQGFINNGIPLSQFLPPNLNSAPGTTSATGNHIVPLYNYAAAPMGLSTFGLANTTGTVTPYILNTTSLEGTFSTGDPWGVQTQSLYFSGQESYGAQLNTVMVNTTLDGQTSFAPNPDTPPYGCPGFPSSACPNDFWLQNVINYNPFSGTLSFENNIWNFSTPTGAFPSTTILHGLGRVVSGEVYEEGGPSTTISYPFTLDLYLNTTVGSYLGSPLVNEVYFNYSVYNSAGHLVCPVTEPTGELCGMYDNVYFNSKVNVPFGSAQIQANGYQYNPLGLPTDMEMDWGIGTSSGAQANTVYANATLGLYVWNATTHTYQIPYSTYDFGSETGETSAGGLTTWNMVNGQPVAYYRTGPSLLMGLWNAGTAPGANPLNYAHISPGNAFIAVAPGLDTTNQSYFQVAPTFGWFTPRGRIGANIWLAPGTYTVEVMLSGYNEVTVPSVDLHFTGQSLSITLVRSVVPVVYTPLWAFSSTDLANLSLSGAGTSASPYIMPSSQPGSLAPVFAILNDYLFIVWSGVLLNATTAYVDFNPPPSLSLTYPSWWLFQLDDLAAAYGPTPLEQQLPIYLDLAQNVTIAHAASIGGWSSDIEVGHNYNVYVNGGKNNLFYDNYFNVSSEGLDFLGAGVYVAPVISFAAVGTTYTVTFTETGLPGGVPWTATLNGHTQSSRLTTIVFTGFTNGPYSYSVGAVTGYSPSPSSGTVTVSGANAIQAITFTPVGTTYSVVFTESGLPNGAQWSVTLNGITQVNTSTTIVFTGFTNGPYGYTVAAINGYTASVTSGTATVSGGKLTVPTITFTAVGTVETVTFTEAWLPIGSQWSVTLNGNTQTSESTTIVYPGFTNGVYSYTVAAVSGYTASTSASTVKVQGTNQHNYVWGNTFNPYSNPGYSGMSAPSTGLAVSETNDHIYNNALYTNGTASSSATFFNFWNATGGYQSATNSITVNGFALTGSILGQNIQGGNYWRNYGSVADPYGVPYVARASSPAGSASIGNGGDYAPLTPYMNVALASTVPGALGVGLYAITFTEVGLGLTNSWTMRLAGVPVNEPLLATTYTTSPSNTTVVGAGLTTNTLWAPNGTYTWTVAVSPTGSSALVSSGTVTVAPGAAVTVTFAWQVTVRETGLTSGLTWATTFNGALQVTTATSLVFTVVPGTYSYSVSALPSGWTVTLGTASPVTVTNAAKTLNVTFAASVPTYSVYFTASGIFPGTSFSVSFNGGGAVSSGGTSQVVFNAVAAGLYPYVVTAPTGYTLVSSTPSSPLTVSSSSVSVALVFTPTTYTVTFTETGLPSGTVWGLSFGGVFHWGTAGSGASSITFQAAGSAGGTLYNWLIGFISGELASPSSGSTTVFTSNPAPIAIGFT